MQDHGKVYGLYIDSICVYDILRILLLGFTLSLHELEATIPTLWRTTKGSFKLLLIPKDPLNFFGQSS